MNLDEQKFSSKKSRSDSIYCVETTIFSFSYFFEKNGLEANFLIIDWDEVFRKKTDFGLNFVWKSQAFFELKTTQIVRFWNNKFTTSQSLNEQVQHASDF